MVPKWVRGTFEYASIESSPGNTINVPVCALGGSVATPSSGISANVIEVKNFKELEDIHKGISELSELEKRIMTHTGRIPYNKLYKDKKKLGEVWTETQESERLINIDKEVAWLKDCSTCHY